MLRRLLAKRQARQRAVLGAIASFAVLLTAILYLTETLDTTLQTAVYDRALTNSPAEVRGQITIVAIDDPTIKQYGPWPLPRQAYTDLVRALKPLQPSSIVFDVGFYDPSANVEEDRALATAIKDAGNVLLAMQGAGDGVLGDHTTHYVNILLPIPLLREAAAGVGAVNVNPDPDGRVRDTPLLINGPDGTTYYSLPLVAA